MPRWASGTFGLRLADMSELVEDPGDPRIAVFLGLRNHAERQRRELPGGDHANTFVCEGDIVIERALAAGHTLRSVLVSAKRTKPLPSLPTNVAVFAGNDAVLETVTGRPELRDPLACFDRPTTRTVDDVLDGASLVAVLEGLNNPNNLGVIMRNAAGLGVDAVLLDPTCGDPLYRRAIRASMGQVFTIPFARADGTATILSALHARGYRSLALTPSGDQRLDEFTSSTPVAVLLGAEGPGLTDATIDQATDRVRIHMERNVDSLNVANAAAIAFHQLRQRT